MIQPSATSKEIYLNIKDWHHFRVTVRKNIFQQNGPRKQAGIGILVSNRFQTTINQKRIGRTPNTHQGESTPS